MKDYRDLGQKLPAILTGVAMGGATAHLALSTGSVFLPQAFVLTLKGGSPGGNVLQYYQRAAELARNIAAQDKSLLTIQHFDPVHDGWLTQAVNHLRLKLLEVPEAYRRFIQAHLTPGGEVIYLEGKAQWRRYRLGPRSVFQVGGWGAIPPEEYLSGSPRLHDYCLRTGMDDSAWRLDDFPLEVGPESEWGSEPEYGEALEEWCRREGYRFTRITLDDPNDFSRLAFFSVNLRLKRAGRTPPGVVIEMFTQYDATVVERTGLLPLWLIFNTTDSLEYLRSMVRFFPDARPVFFSALSTFSNTPDLAPWEAWQAALQGFDVTNAGARRGHYPSDPQALVDWAEPLRAWEQAHPARLGHKLTGADLEELAQKIASERGASPDLGGL
ncbi:MAG: hypothetical protein VB089_00075 [Anaerolineaceae bacterium]|nr:hypothetical protein [Anaerolineaceae bacterium]